jgi:hypothetical protein
MEADAVRAAGSGTALAVRRREVTLPRLRVDPGVWDDAGDGPLRAHILLGDRALILEARPSDGGRRDAAAQLAEIGGRAYVVVAYER